MAIRAPFFCSAAVIIGLGLAGCKAPDGPPDTGLRTALVSKNTLDASFDAALLGHLRQKPDGDLKALLAEYAEAKRANRRDKVDRAINTALKRSTGNAGLHSLNGSALLDHFMRARNRADLEHAIEALSVSERLDPTNQTTVYLLGYALFWAKSYPAAQQAFARAVLLNSEDQEALYGLAAASYMAADPISADAALNGLAAVGPLTGEALRLRAYVSAALGDFERARQAAETMPGGGASETIRRLGDWQAIHDRRPGRGNRAVLATKDVPDGQPMVILDVVIIATEDDVSSSRGVNLLNGLQIQFAGGRHTTHESDRLDPFNNISTSEIIRNVTLPSITYSMNIANAFGSRNEILAKPTLVALEGEESTFFSGSHVLAGATAGDETIEIEDDIGVGLTLTPLEIIDGRVVLNVEVRRTFLKAPDSDIEFQFRLETSKVEVSATVDIAMNETLILGGLSERETAQTSDGVPLLQNIPVVQYGFKRKVKRDFQRSVLILLTPRAPNYVYRPGAALARGGPGSDLGQLQARFSDWFRPYPNWASIFAHLQSNQLYREFRTGDVALESWTTPDTVQWRAQEIVDAIFF